MDLAAAVAWARQALDSEIVETCLLTAGNARLTAQLTIAGPPRKRVILRHESGGGPLADSVFSLEREAAVCRALETSDLPTPKVLAGDPELSIILTEWLPGEGDSHAAAMDDYLRCLGRLHAIDPTSLNLPGFTASIHNEIDTWRGIFMAKAPGSSAVAEYALLRLRECVPTEPRHTVLCHGDAGTGNYLREGQRVTAMLDWEMAHLGDPLDDLAWITVRAAQFGVDLGDFGERIEREYGAGGLDLHDLERIRFWQAFGLLRMLIICLSAAAQPRLGKERLLQMTLIPVIEFQLLEAIATMDGRSIVDSLANAPLDAAAFPGDLVHEAAADINDSLLPRLRGDNAVENWTKRIRNLLNQIAMAAPPDRAHRIPSLDSLAEQTAARLRWLPAGTSQARRKLATLTPAGRLENAK
jgi:aminoglycoside phosphotransferase (APT) family kinase protein